jgi:hypothetical protein
MKWETYLTLWSMRFASSNGNQHECSAGKQTCHQAVNQSEQAQERINLAMMAWMRKKLIAGRQPKQGNN